MRLRPISMGLLSDLRSKCVLLMPLCVERINQIPVFLKEQELIVKITINLCATCLDHTECQYE